MAGDLQKLGVVVVGLGIAGRVRVRDILQTSREEDSRWNLIGYISRREVEIDGAVQVTEEDALNRSDVHAVLVCTEPGAHQDIIRKSLQHGKHVLVEYPVTTSQNGTQELYSLASEKGLVLHEENIALLTESFQHMQEALKTATSPVVQFDLNLVGSYNGWIEDFEKTGGPVSVSMVQTLYVLFGSDVKATAGSLVTDEEGFTATATLTSAKCSNLNLKIRRTKEKSRRQKTWRIELSDGSVIDDNPEKQAPPNTSGVSKKVGLFMQDFLLFVREVYNELEYSANKEMVLHCIGVVDHIHRLMGLKSDDQHSCNL